MTLIRDRIDSSYPLSRDIIFALTKNNPEIAHVLFTGFSNVIHRMGIEKLLFDCPENYYIPDVKIANAAGFNKDGKIPPQFLKYLGHDVNIVGTVTKDPWKGNTERPRMWRFPRTKSIANYLGLPGEGAEKVAENLARYGYHNVPIIVSVMSTPGKTGNKAIKDVRDTTRIMRNSWNVQRFQFNGSCPNTPEAEDMLEAYLQTIKEGKFPGQEIEIKVPPIPDVDEGEIERIITIGEKYGVKLIAATNTTKHHDSKYITKSPGKGGASGHALYDQALKTQRIIESKLNEINSNMEISAVGGIDSTDKARERLSPRVTRIEILTGLIYEGPGLIRELRTAT